MKIVTMLARLDDTLVSAGTDCSGGTARNGQRTGTKDTNAAHKSLPRLVFSWIDMRLDYAFLAERAARLDDGRLVVFGGDVDLVETAGLPAVFQTSLVARMTLDDGESPEGHTFGVALTTPDGKHKVVAENQHLNAPQNIPEGMLGGAGLVVGMTLGIGQPGIYRIHLIVDGVELKTIPLKVENPPKTPAKEQVKNDNANTDEANNG